jgi:hypothetical protein
MLAVVPEQIEVVPEINAVGKAFTVTIAEPVRVWLQDGVPEEVTLTKAYVLFAVNDGVVIELVPDPFNTIV